MAQGIPIRVKDGASFDRPLFSHEPRREQEVVCLFCAIAPCFEVPLILEKVQTPFPDLTLRRADTGETLRYEFELYGRHFKEHGHDPRACDGMICWIDDWGSWPSDFDVIELHELVTKQWPELIESIGDHGPRVPWTRKTFLAECVRNKLSAEVLDRIETIIDFAATKGLGPEWLSDSKATFAVRDRDQFFKVDASGQIVFPFSRLKSDRSFTELVSRLNTALGREEFSGEDHATKGKGGDIRSFFESRESLQAFLEVWAWYAVDQP